ncbi:hypothetical protein SAV14893_074520 [Streptomyces avermitilis]|uniref:Uncharacterized protein n=1 Tax=Streptomyces avermitilis TaxID=33903 RepID=A0A4D4M8T8_STRAX|nr:hypothetical protein SAV14893_074520 [Streptomyces avermitilis]GDY71604.1 hypothetical protein SAV31267_010890 [Streptomyces avermitilis]
MPWLNRWLRAPHVCEAGFEGAERVHGVARDGELGRVDALPPPGRPHPHPADGQRQQGADSRGGFTRTSNYMVAVKARGAGKPV